MTDFQELHFHSKAFRKHNFKRMLDFAIRGLPRHVLRGEQYVDANWAFGIYEQEIRQLDAFEIDPKWFSSGVLGAALISQVLWPETLELWRRLAHNDVYRDECGSDAPGFLREIIERHQNDRRLTRSQLYQMFLFQAALSMARAWVHHADPGHLYAHLPPVPDAAELIAEVRQLRGERHTKTGFRPPAVTREHWIELDMPQVIHEPNVSQVMALAKRASTLEEAPPSEEALKDALDWVIKPHPPRELEHPAAMAAAVVTIARFPACEALWDRAFTFIGCRKPNDGHKPYSDISACLLDCILLANRSNHPKRAATALYDRARMLVNLWLEEPDQFRVALPRTNQKRPLDRLWADLNVNFTPRILFHNKRPSPILRSEPDDSGGQEGSNSASTRKKMGADTAGKRLRTGRKAEQWFIENYQSVCAAFQGVSLVDRREAQTGYDFKLKPDEGYWYVETKAASDGNGSVSLTDCQWARARLEGDKYFLVTIRGIDTSRPEAIVIRNPAAHLKPHRREILVPRVDWHVDIADLEMAAARNPQ